MNKEAVKAILEKALRHEATPEEYSKLMEWIKTDEDYELSALIGDHIASAQQLTTGEADEAYDHDYWNKLCLEIISKDVYGIGLPFAYPEKTITRLPFLRRKYWAAASILVLLGAATFFWLYNEKTNTEKDIKKELAATQDVQPGKNKAVLILADGSSIQLDSTGNSQITADSGVMVNKKGGRLEYIAAAEIPNRSDQYNTLSTPRGGQYQLVLPDGSQVWLNAASSIRYPIAFPDDSRTVEVTGEVYFDVKKDAARPFIVKGGGQEVQVLGTAFNMNIYEDEPSKKITLIDGAVQVKPMEASIQQQPRWKATLKPGQQAKVNRATNTMDVVVADTEAVIAWKNGLFHTRKTDIAELMRQIGRWYDVEVNLAQLPPEKTIPTFSGSINRNLTLSQIVQILELSDVKVKIEGKQITILP
jgi:transmembrane sensor